jgi:hypothetical protein|tara:strand:- start:574 stop:693 length:120 start_codon:yes stop_codon:yes gene_type:complete
VVEQDIQVLLEDVVHKDHKVTKEIQEIQELQVVKAPKVL